MLHNILVTWSTQGMESKSMGGHYTISAKSYAKENQRTGTVVSESNSEMVRQE